MVVVHVHVERSSRGRGRTSGGLLGTHILLSSHDWRWLAGCGEGLETDEHEYGREEYIIGCSYGTDVDWVGFSTGGDAIGGTRSLGDWSMGQQQATGKWASGDGQRGREWHYRVQWGVLKR